MNRAARMRQLATLALEVAAIAPDRFSKYGTTTYIPRELVERIRAECDEQKIDWRRVKADVRDERLAFKKYDDAVRDLGPELGGFSIADLLADNFPWPLEKCQTMAARVRAARA